MRTYYSPHCESGEDILYAEVKHICADDSCRFSGLLGYPGVCLGAKAKGYSISYDTAMETILKDGKVVEFMADVKQKDHAAWEKIKEWFKNLAKFLQKMVDAYKAQSAQTIEGARVAEFSEDLLNQIKQIWGEGAVTAGENYQTAEVKENTTKNSERSTTKFDDRDTTDFDQSFDYSQLNWAFDLGIITGKDSAIFERTINNEIFRGAEPQSANGEYIIDTGKCLMFTDGDFHNPTLSRVIVFATEYESLTDYAKRRIIDEAEATGKVKLSLSAIESIFGEGFVSLYTRPNGQTYARQTRGRKGSNGSGTAQTTRAKSLKERFAEEGLSHLLEDDADSGTVKRSDRDSDSVSNRTLLANALESVAQNDMERNRIAEYKEKIGQLDAQEKKLRELNAQIKELSFAKGPRDTKKIRELRDEAIMTTNRIGIYDKQLLRLESAKPLQDISLSGDYCAGERTGSQ